MRADGSQAKPAIAARDGCWHKQATYRTQGPQPRSADDAARRRGPLSAEPRGNRVSTEALRVLTEALRTHGGKRRR